MRIDLTDARTEFGPLKRILHKGKNKFLQIILERSVPLLKGLGLTLEFGSG